MRVREVERVLCAAYPMGLTAAEVSARLGGRRGVATRLWLLRWRGRVESWRDRYDERLWWFVPPANRHPARLARRAERLPAQRRGPAADA